MPPEARVAEDEAFDSVRHPPEVAQDPVAVFRVPCKMQGRSTISGAVDQLTLALQQRFVNDVACNAASRCLPLFSFRAAAPLASAWEGVCQSSRKVGGPLRQPGRSFFCINRRLNRGGRKRKGARQPATASGTAASIAVGAPFVPVSPGRWRRRYRQGGGDNYAHEDWCGN